MSQEQEIQALRAEVRTLRVELVLKTLLAERDLALLDGDRPLRCVQCGLHFAWTADAPIQCPACGPQGEDTGRQQLNVFLTENEYLSEWLDALLGEQGLDDISKAGDQRVQCRKCLGQFRWKPGRKCRTCNPRQPVR